MEILGSNPRAPTTIGFYMCQTVSKQPLYERIKSGTPPKQAELKPYRTVGPFLIRNYLYYEKIICPVEPMPTGALAAYDIQESQKVEK